jgi:hypothetical protein
MLGRLFRGIFIRSGAGSSARASVTSPSSPPPTRLSYEFASGRYRRASSLINSQNPSFGIGFPSPPRTPHSGNRRARHLWNRFAALEELAVSYSAACWKSPPVAVLQRLCRRSRLKTSLFTPRAEPVTSRLWAFGRDWLVGASRVGASRATAHWRPNSRHIVLHRSLGLLAAASCQNRDSSCAGSMSFGSEIYVNTWNIRILRALSSVSLAVP